MPTFNLWPSWPQVFLRLQIIVLLRTRNGALNFSLSLLTTLGVIFFKTPCGFENHFVIAPSLEESDLPWCIGLVIDHHIRIVAQLPQGVDAVQVFFHCVAKVGQYMHVLQKKCIRSRMHSFFCETTRWALPLTK